MKIDVSTEVMITDDQRGRETLDGTGTEEEQHDTCQEGGHLAIDDGGIGI